MPDGARGGSESCPTGKPFPLFALSLGVRRAGGRGSTVCEEMARRSFEVPCKVSGSTIPPRPVCQPEQGFEEAAGLGQGRDVHRCPSKTYEVFKVWAGNSSKSQ